MRKKEFVFLVLFALFFVSCDKKMQPSEPISVFGEENAMEIPFEFKNGVRFVNVKLNGVAMEMIFDTGASGVSLSLTEASFLAKQGKLTDQDIIGSTNISIADGSVYEGLVVNIKELEFAEGVIVNNVKAIVTNNMNAPLLLGNTALEEFGSFEIDDDLKVIRFSY